MKASRFSEAQKAFILKQDADGMPVADICRKAGSEGTGRCRVAWFRPSAGPVFFIEKQSSGTSLRAHRR
jgi:hypothetical protein